VNETITVSANQQVQYKIRSHKTYEKRNTKVELIETESEGKHFTKTERTHILCSGDTQPRTRFQHQNKKGVGVHAINDVQRAYQ
jgi:hypothetical protein